MAERTCSIDGCEEKHSARGWCYRHYREWWDANGPIRPEWPTTEELFWAKVHKTDTCWLWTGNCKPTGYGKYQAKRKHWAAHRLAYTLMVGPIPDGMEIDHLCRNRGCVRPDHLDVLSRDVGYG